jgi:hypothetical protein
MINVIIQAGFGNQLFQYAMGYALAKETNQQLGVDISYFEYAAKHAHANLRISNLDKLQLENPYFINKPERYYKFFYGAKLAKTPFWRLMCFPNQVLWEDVQNCRLYQEDLIAKAHQLHDVAMYGFWQNTKYFDRYINDLKRQFVPNYPFHVSVQTYVKQISMVTNSVGVHIRRGDFVGLGWAEGEEYYTRAMQRLAEELPECRFFIVTDDKKWAREHFSDKSDIIIIDIKTDTCDIDEFYLLSICKHHIISESTFGWWAAFLNTNKDSRVIVPSYAKGEMFLDKWIRL